MVDSFRPRDQRLLSTEQAFAVMTEFLNRYSDRAGDDLLTLIGDVTLLADKGPTDPAAWDDWVSCVDKVLGGTPLN